MSRAARTGTGVQAGAATSGGLLFTYGGIVVGPALFGALARVAGFGAALLALGALVAARLVGTPLPRRLDRRHRFSEADVRRPSGNFSLAWEGDLRCAVTSRPPQVAEVHPLRS